MNRKIWIMACILGVTSVIFGAFGAHALREWISIEAQQTFETGVRYQMYHALLLLFVGFNDFISTKTKKIVTLLVVLGVFLFSGSIYGLATNSLTAFDFKAIGFITPVGGFLLIFGWFLMIIDLLKSKVKND